MLILTERTPNPEALKFIPPERLTGGGHWSFERDAPEAAHSLLAGRLLELPGVRRIFICADFVTVMRDPDGPAWDTLKYSVLAAMAEHFESGAPAVDEAAAPRQTVAEQGLLAEIQAVLDKHVRPAVARDGGEIELDHFDPATGALWIRMRGACGGCPSARGTLKTGVEQVVRRYVPEVLTVEEVVASAATTKSPSRIRQWLAKVGSGKADASRTVFTHGGREIRSASGEPVSSRRRLG